MLQSGERETEILLGNKQLLAIFFVVAALLGVAFTGGYMLGRGSLGRKPSSASNMPGETVANANGAEINPAAPGVGGETHAVPPDDSGVPASAGVVTAQNQAHRAQNLARETEEPLGSRKKKKAPAETEVPAGKAQSDAFVPQGGQEFLQVTAVARDDANAVAAVLRKRGFRAHAVPKPGSANLYRVIVGPIKDAGDLASTRDSLRRTGFRDVIVQHYQ